MEKIKLYIILLIVIISCKQKEVSADITKHSVTKLISNNDKEAIEFLKNFYLTFYSTDEVKSDREELLKEYVSERILNRMDSLTSDGDLILDYDPFIKAQDFDYIILQKTLEIEPLKEKNEYKVSFLLSNRKDEKRVYINYLLKKNKNENFLIYSILNDEYLNFEFHKNIPKKLTIEELLKKNKSTPENIINYLIFLRDTNGNLEINTEILDHISKTTSKENSIYLSALENYAYKSRENLGWSLEEHSKIKAYIFNTSYPLRKKYWSDKYEEWYEGKPDVFLGDLDEWKNNNYYGLPNLEKYVYDFRKKLGWIQDWE